MGMAQEEDEDEDKEEEEKAGVNGNGTGVKDRTGGAVTGVYQDKGCNAKGLIRTQRSLRN